MSTDAREKRRHSLINKAEAGRQEGKKRGLRTAPCKHGILFHGYCRHRATVHCLLAVTGIAAVRVYDPGLIIPQFEHLGAEFGAKSATDAKIHINFRRSHNDPFLVARIVGI